MALERTTGTRPAIFVDKDGTLIPDIPYNVDPARITLSPGAGETLARLQAEGFRLVVVSNQSGIARGMFAESALIPVRDRINRLLGDFGASLDGFYYCPHLPASAGGAVAGYAIDCECRRPKAGMLRQSARELGIDLARSWMIGDITADHEAGKSAGCRTILIEKPDDPLPAFAVHNRPDFIVRGWAEIGDLILSADPGQPGGQHEHHLPEAN